MKTAMRLGAPSALLLCAVSVAVVPRARGQEVAPDVRQFQEGSRLGREALPPGDGWAADLGGTTGALGLLLSRSLWATTEASWW